MQPSEQDDDIYPGNDCLPDISGVTFDHHDKGGKQVKFLWGVGTSSYQVEGNITSNDWSVFLGSPAVRERVDGLAKLAKISFKLEDPGRADNHWDLGVFGEDVKRAKYLGMNSYRLSLEWSRLQPTGACGAGSAAAVLDGGALSHYRGMLGLLAENGLEPIVTLNHFTLPRWVLTPPTTLLGTEDEGFKKSLGGWSCQGTVDAFVKYVGLVATEFKDAVKYWITINEPLSIVASGYLAGLWSPGFILAEDHAKKAFFNLVDAHVRAYDEIKSVAGKESSIGLAHGMVFPKAKAEMDILGLNRRAAVQYDYCFNRAFLEAVTDGICNPTLMVENKDRKIVESWKDRLDFVGLNYYRSAYVYHNELLSLAAPWAGGIFDEDLAATGEGHNLLNDLGWEVYPAGMYRLLKYLDARFGMPILVTENGFAETTDPLNAGHDKQGIRAQYVVAHLSEVLHAIKEGVNVLGYVHWSLVDNWEWDYDYLPRARFGLFTVDRDVLDAGAPLPRSQTRGSVALKYVIGQGRLGDAAERFGSITPSGSSLIPPKQA